MESMQYAEALVKELLLFRGFTHTLKSFDAEVEADAGHGFQVDRIVDLVFIIYVPQFEADNLVKLLVFLEKSFLASADPRYHSTFMKLEIALKKYYIVHAVQKGQPDQVLLFFQRHGDSLLRNGRGDEWHSWFAIPYMKHPSIDPRFQVYFSKEWLDTLVVSFRNFLSEALDGIPKIKNFADKRKNMYPALKQDLANLQAECSRLRSIVQKKEALILKLESDYQFATNRAEANGEDENKRLSIPSQPSVKLSGNEKGREPSSTDDPVSKADQDRVSEAILDDMSTIPTTEVPWIADAPKVQNEESVSEKGRNWSREEEIPHVIVESQVGWTLFLVIRAPSQGAGFPLLDQMLPVPHLMGLIWTPDAAASTSRNATIYCGAEILALEWENKYDRLVLLGTVEGGVKAWNVEAKRVVCDVSTDPAFPRILELKCSPTDSVFLSVATTDPGKSREGAEAVGFGSVTVWNMRTWKLLNVLPLGEDPPVVTSVCFNHNGKLVAAGATDGMIRLFDMNGCLPITGWPAHDGCAVSSVKFGNDHSSIFSLGGDGKVLEWSLHNQGQILQSQDASMFCSIVATKLPRHEMTLDSRGKSLLLSSNLHSAPLFNFDGPVKTYRTLNHNGAVTSVDWHPLLPMFLTGSTDHSVRVTSIS